MTFLRPRINDIVQRVQADFDVNLPGADSRLRRSVEGVLARVIAMAAHELYGYLDWIARQVLPDTADAEILDRHGNLWGRNRKIGSPASGIVRFTGADDAIVPSGTIVRRADDQEYIVHADVTIAGGTGDAEITAVEYGAAGNSIAVTKVSLVSPIAGIQSEATVQADGLTGGTDIESDSDLRGRIIERIQQPPHGGAAHDYVAWAKEVSGVTRAWVYPLQLGVGTVVVLFVMDNKAGTIIPSPTEVDAVQDHIDLVRPVTADVSVAAPDATPVNFTIHLSPNTVAVQTAVKAEIEDLFKREAQPGGTMYLSRINEAISSAAAEFDHVLVSPSANVVSSFGDMPTVGAFTWGAI